MPSYFKKLLYILPAKKAKIIQMVLLFILASVLEVVGIGVIGPFIALANDFELINQHTQLKQLFEGSGISQPSQFIAFLGIFVAIAFCTKTFFSWFTQTRIIRFCDRQQHLLIVKVVHQYLEAPYIYHTRKNSSAIVDSIIEIANTFTMTVLNPLLTTIANILVVFCLFILLYVTSPSTMIVLLVTFLPVFIFFNLFKSSLKQWGKQMRDSKEKIIYVINHAFGSIKETKLIGCESYFESQIDAYAEQLEKAHGDFFTFKVLPRFIIEAIMVVCIVGIVSVSLLLSRSIQDLTAVLGVYALATIRMLPAISNVLTGINQLRNSSYTVNQIYLEVVELDQIKKEEAASTVITFAPEDAKVILEPSPTYKPLNELSFKNEVILNRVSYRYPNAYKPAITDISLSIKQGESIAFIGKSGAGKTTLVDIILGLLIPQSGDILIDGTSIYPNLRAWQNLIGYIPQSIFLTDDTIERNIAFGVPKHLIDHQKVQNAIEAAQLEGVIENLADGINTKVGERGILLSGGQRQRVGIARALYHDRAILVLDEATAALDGETEKLVTEAIKSLSGKQTIITIAHRLSTIEHCDRIYQLEQGKITKSGNYQEVILAGFGV